VQTSRIMQWLGVAEGRRVCAALAVAVLAAGCSGNDSEAGGPVATPDVSAETPVAETSTPTPTPTEDAVAAELAELRETDRFLELAEHDRASTATWARFGWEAFAPHADGEKLFEWANKAELWDSVAPPFRDECLLAGPEATRPMWDAEVLIPAGIEPRWSNDSTGGRGQFVEFLCLYHDEGTDQPVERWGAVLIATDEHLVGEVVAEKEFFEVREDDYDSFEARREGVRERLWDWLGEQPVVDPPE
jgi:hypothetical protein